MANVFRQFLLDAENGDINAVKRNIENGIELEARDEVGLSTKRNRFDRLDLGSTNCISSICKM